MTAKKKEAYGIIEYYEAPKDMWQTNDVELDALSSFTNRCHTASRLAILDMYLDLGLVERMSFSSFILMLAAEKKKSWACPFRLVSEIPEITSELADAEIEDSLYDTKWKDDNIDTVNSAFSILATSNPHEINQGDLWQN